MREIEWTQDGIDSLNEILEYYYERAGEDTARNNYNKIIKEIDLLQIEEIKTKKCRELADIGINDIHELLINPWKVYYKISENNKNVYIMLVLDARRNIEEILINKVIDGKIS